MPETTSAEIRDYLQRNWNVILADIEKLVEIESTEDLARAREHAPFGPGPRRALDKALEIAADMGLDVHDCEGYIGYADLPGTDDTQIAIIGHVDVVPAGPGWSCEPYALTRRAGYLLGRGVIDDKGPLVVALHAVKFWKDRHEVLPHTVRVLFGANEETNMKDVAYYREHYPDPDFLFTPDSQFPLGYGESGICSGELASAPVAGNIIELEGGQAVNAVPGVARAVIVSERAPEPGERVTVADLGDGRYEIVARGTSAHASTPELGENAIGILARYLVERGIGTPEESEFLELLAGALSATDGSTFGVACEDGDFGALTMVGGVIRLDDGRLHQSLDFRYPTTITASEIERKVGERAARSHATFEMLHDKEPFLMNPDSPAVRALLDAYCEVTGEQAGGLTSKGGTYARCFTTGVSFGPEKPWTSDPEWVGGMHGPDEGVSEALLKEAFEIYALALGKLMEIDL